MIKLNTFQKDSLGEMANIGSGKASNSLSKLIKKKVILSTPQIKLIPITQVARAVSGPKQLVVSVLSRLQGDVQGTILVIFPKLTGI